MNNFRGRSFASVTACNEVSSTALVRSIKRPGRSSGGTKVVERLGRAIFSRATAPGQVIAIDKDYSTRHAPIISAGLAFAPQEEQLHPPQLITREPAKVLILTPGQYVSLTHAIPAAPSRSMGPFPRRIATFAQDFSCASSAVVLSVLRQAVIGKEISP